MAERFRCVGRPRGLWRWLARLPIGLYRARLGWLLGDRFLMLAHVGRKSGSRRHTVLEVMRRDRASDTYYVAAGFGGDSDWLLNVAKTPDVVVHVGLRQWAAVAERLSPDDAAHEIAEFARRHPAGTVVLARVLGLQWDGTAEGPREWARALPIVALRPKSAGS